MADLSDWGDFLSGLSNDVASVWKVANPPAVISPVPKAVNPNAPLGSPTTTKVIQYVAIAGGAIALGFGLFWLVKRL